MLPQSQQIIFFYIIFILNFEASCGLNVILYDALTSIRNAFFEKHKFTQYTYKINVTI